MKAYEVLRAAPNGLILGIVARGHRAGHGACLVARVGSAGL